MIIEYIATRSLIAGRAVGEVIEFEFNLTRKDRATNTNSNTLTALDGTQTTRIHSHIVTYGITTATLKDGDADIMREFLSSVAGGETFTVRFNDTDEAETYVLSGNHSERRVGQLEWFRFSFRIRAA